MCSNLLCFWLILSWGCVLIVIGQRTFLDSPKNIALYRKIRWWLSSVVGRTGTDVALVKAAIDSGGVQPYYHESFPCNITIGKSKTKPTSVHQLRPGDIDIIAAMGDSLTAGLGVFATNIFQIVVENRGVSFSGGGQADWRTYLTLPNILKEFNPNLFGFTKTDAYSFDEASEFNVAESGAMSRDMPYMARILIKRLKKDPRVNIKKHWKMITIMIGANDFCLDMCYLPEPSQTLENHKQDLLNVLRLLKNHLPKTLVSIIPPPNLKLLVDIVGRSGFCELTVDFECSCLFGLYYRDKRKQFYDIMRRWQGLEHEIAQYTEFQTDNFTVIVQGFTKNLSFPKTEDGVSNFSYLSKDCFHISQKGNARTANALWNNLMESVGEKSQDWSNLFEKFVCPTEEKPFIATYHNSKQSNEV